MITSTLGDLIPNVGFFNVFDYAVTIIILVAAFFSRQWYSHKIIMRMSESDTLGCVFIIPLLG